MIRRLAALAAVGLLLSACGTVSATSALRSWVSQSGFHANSASLHTDAVHTALALRSSSSTVNDLHTVCAVLHEEAQQANAALPTPDPQATMLLARAYSEFGDAANRCYGAATSASARAVALRSLEGAVATLAEGSARVAAAS